MTKEELKQLAFETARELFPEGEKNGELFEIVLTELPHNGVLITIRVHTPHEKLTKVFSVCDCAVYAIAGKENIQKSIYAGLGYHSKYFGF